MLNQQVRLENQSERTRKPITPDLARPSLAGSARIGGHALAHVIFSFQSPDLFPRYSAKPTQSRLEGIITCASSADFRCAFDWGENRKAATKGQQTICVRAHHCGILLHTK